MVVLRVYHWALLFVSSFGLMTAIAFGADEAAKEAPPPPPAPLVTFEADIQPLFTRLGCNAGACHGKSRGQNGFALSLLAFDQDFDYASIVQEGRGRRI